MLRNCMAVLTWLFTRPYPRGIWGTVKSLLAAVPTIATRVGGIPEVIRAHQTGWLVPPRNPRALWGAIADALSDPARSMSMAQFGRERTLNQFDVRHLPGRSNRFISASSTTNLDALRSLGTVAAVVPAGRPQRVARPTLMPRPYTGRIALAIPAPSSPPNGISTISSTATTRSPSLRRGQPDESARLLPVIASPSDRPLPLALQ